MKPTTSRFADVLASPSNVVLLFIAATLCAGFFAKIVSQENFIYIAGSDLIPELRKDTPEPKKAALQMVCIVGGVLVMLLLLLLE